MLVSNTGRKRERKRERRGRGLASNRGLERGRRRRREGKRGEERALTSNRGLGSSIEPQQKAKEPKAHSLFLALPKHTHTASAAIPATLSIATHTHTHTHTNSSTHTTSARLALKHTHSIASAAKKKIPATPLIVSNSNICDRNVGCRVLPRQLVFLHFSLHILTLILHNVLPHRHSIGGNTRNTFHRTLRKKNIPTHTSPESVCTSHTNTVHTQQHWGQYPQHLR